MTLWSSTGDSIHSTSLSQHFDWATNSMISDLALQGEYTNTELDDITQLFLSHCRLATNDSNT
eukprot:4243045-Ditylum_brightwellii.AAC.1